MNMKMRNIIGLAFIAALMAATSCNNRNFTIEGTINGAAGDTLYLENNKSLFRLPFDCKHCEMAVNYSGKK